MFMEITKMQAQNRSTLNWDTFILHVNMKVNMKLIWKFHKESKRGREREKDAISVIPKMQCNFYVNN